MNKQVFFANMFPDFQPPVDLSQAVICAADVDVESRRVRLELSNPTYISKRALDQVSAGLRHHYGLNQVTVSPKFPAEQCAFMDQQELMDLFVAQDSFARASLAGASWDWEGNTLKIGLVANGKEDLLKCVPQVVNSLKEMFGVKVNIEIIVGNELSGQALFDAMEQMRAQMLKDLPRAAATEAKQPVKEKTEAIYGRPFKGETTPMKNITMDTGTVIVEGRVFNVEHRELKKRNAWVICFDMTDNTGSVRVNRFMETEESATIRKEIKPGKVLRIKGRMTEDRYTGDQVLRPDDIVAGKMEKRQDTAPGEKRVELHLHTSMSNMDALTKTADAIKQAAAWGHRAVAITDHGCVYSFTDALHTVEDWKGAPKVAGTEDDIKVLYGCEGYYVNDVDDKIAIQGTKDCLLTDEYVAFDLETTGLSSRQDVIIEIGAVLMKNGQEVDRFQTFVDPGRKLEPRIIELTGITDAMLVAHLRSKKSSPSFWNSWVIEFWLPTTQASTRPLCGHNVPVWEFPIPSPLLIHWCFHKT